MASNYIPYLVFDGVDADHELREIRAATAAAALNQHQADIFEAYLRGITVEEYRAMRLRARAHENSSLFSREARKENKNPNF